MPSTKSFLTNKQFDALKWVALVGLPAVGALYFALAGLWNLPKAEEVVGTIIALDTFLGLLLGVSTKNYNASDAKYDGTLEVFKQDTRMIHQLEIATPPDEIGNKDSITLKVSKTDAELPEDLK